MSRFLYSLLTFFLLPLIFLRVWWKGRRLPEYRQKMGERFGLYDASPSGPIIWIHAVSVGETQAAQPLVKGLREAYPEAEILFTHMTPTGRARSLQLFGPGVLRVYLPYDYSFAMARFLEHFRPSIGIIMETEIWPNLTAECRSRGIPLLLANARLSQRSAGRYARFPRLTRQTMMSLSAVAAQTDEDASRLHDLGAENIQVVGNVKFDAVPPPDQLSTGAFLRRLIGSRLVLLAASTRDGEEKALLDALVKKPLAGALLLIVPRHPERFHEVEHLAQARGFKVQRRSLGQPVEADTQVLLGDSMGEMFAYYTACDVAFVGGSLLPLGGQNLIEACAIGRPVLVGPHTYNFLDATEKAIQVGATLRVADADELIALTRVLFSDANAREAMGVAGRQFSAAHRGATKQTLSIIAGLLKRKAAPEAAAPAAQ
ncbi:MAG: lipid IV(A) 3-deoxy-D-manno-octulosonic acid transferase [Rhodocyclaceae bacterium]|nr:lipid IV(A) 3-deoxy-D-manno-octulosonic acid transferase [Rhodocyclaceae bacterium]